MTRRAVMRSAMSTFRLHMASPARGRGGPVLLAAAALLAAAGMGIGIAVSDPWLILAVVAVLIALVYLMSSGRALFLVVFIAMPFVGMLWFAKFNEGHAGVSAQSVVIAAIFTACVATIMVKRVVLPRSLFLPVILFVLVNAIAVLLTPNLMEGVISFLRVVCALPLVFVVPAIIDELPGPRTLLRIFFITMSIVYTTVLLQPLGVLPYTSFEDNGAGRATGLYYHPWDVARYLLIAMPLVLAALSDRRVHGFERWAYWVFLGATVAVTFVTFLKAAWIAVLLEVLLWLLMTGKPQKAFLVFIVVGLVVLFPGRAIVTTAFSDLGKLSDSSKREEALSGRVFIWSGYVRGLRSASLGEIIIGQGYVPAGSAETRRTVHNDYLRLLVMNGVVGLATYLVMMLVALRYLARAVHVLRPYGGLPWRFAVAAICLTIGYLTTGLTADPAIYPSITIYVWLLIGVVIGYARLAVAGRPVDTTVDVGAW